MKIVVDQGKLAQKLAAVSAVVPGKTTLSILSNILMQAEDNELRLTATDLDLSMTTTMPAKVEQAGTICVPAKKIGEIIRALPTADVKISTRTDNVRVQCGKSDFKIKGADPEEYPKVTSKMKEKGFTLPGESLNRMIERVIHAVSQDLSRVALTGVLWEFDKNGFSMVATDSHRLAKATRSEKITAGNGKDVIVPGKALQQVQRLMEEDADVKISVGESYIGFDLGNTFVHSRLLEGPFPNYRPVIPTNNENKLTVEREGISQATKRVSILSNVLTHQIKVSVKPDTIGLSVSTPELGEAQEDVVAAYDGPEMDIGFNASYLLDILKSMNGEDVQFELDQPETAAIVRPMNTDKEEDFFCLLMPLRLAD